jgi:hypothetical protein
VAPTQFGGPSTAWIEQRRRADRGLTARVFWRPGGCRDTPREWETFGAGSDAKNLARADGFKRMVEAAGQRWRDGGVKGEGFVRPPDISPTPLRRPEAEPAITMNPPGPQSSAMVESPRPWEYRQPMLHIRVISPPDLTAATVQLLEGSPAVTHL